MNPAPTIYVAKICRGGIHAALQLIAKTTKQKPKHKSKSAATLCLWTDFVSVSIHEYKTYRSKKSMFFCISFLSAC